MPNVFILTLIACWFNTGECITHEATFETSRDCVTEATARIDEYQRDGIDYVRWTCKTIPEASI